MKLGIVIYSDHPETVWNAFRLGVFSIKEHKDEVKIFLMARGVECESLDTDDMNVTGMMQEYVDNGGKILACGTCLKLRGAPGSEMCPMSAMEDLHSLIEESDKVVTF
jgi:uncharacterized protein involved in oxidation of intracellular sulfur